MQAIFDVCSGKKMASIQKKINSSLEQKLKFETPKAEFYKKDCLFLHLPFDSTLYYIARMAAETFTGFDLSRKQGLQDVAKALDVHSYYPLH